MKAVIYVRVSPTKKENTEDELTKSIERQKELCRKRAEANEDELIEIYEDKYVSGKAQKFMKDFNRMVQDAHKSRFERIYCRRVDRFGRNLSEMIETEHKLHDLNISIIFIEEGIDTGNKVGRMLMDILSHVAEWKRDEIVENTKRGREALQRKIDAGETDKRFGRKPKSLNIEEVIKKKNNGMTWKDISDIMELSVPIIQQRLKNEGYYFNNGKVVK